LWSPSVCQCRFGGHVRATARFAGIGIALGALLTSSGCSYLYTIHLSGKIIRGNEQIPVVDAAVKIVRGRDQLNSALTNDEGEWRLVLQIYNANLEQADSDKRCKLIQDTQLPYEFKVEHDGQTWKLPFPEVAFLESEYDACASVLAVIDVKSTTN
jgi:hypothetical protein